MYFAQVLEKYDDFVARPKLLAFWKMGKLNAQKNVNEMLTEPLPIVVVLVRASGGVPGRREAL